MKSSYSGSQRGTPFGPSRWSISVCFDVSYSLQGGRVFLDSTPQSYDDTGLGCWNGARVGGASEELAAAFTQYFRDVQLRLGRLDQVAENSLVATTTTSISRSSLRNMFPHLANNRLDHDKESKVVSCCCQTGGSTPRYARLSALQLGWQYQPR
ncbi:hypothetical protein PI125_g8093 [Phytophthora idaei]|nr:hypothetical protein PI125_g8093 [Phytophthora idaei]